MNSLPGFRELLLGVKQFSGASVYSSIQDGRKLTDVGTSRTKIEDDLRSWGGDGEGRFSSTDERGGGGKKIAHGNLDLDFEVGESCDRSGVAWYH